MRLLALVALATALAACALPSRDNADDPSYRPTGSVAISSGPFVNGACGAANQVGSSVRRGNCLFLDTSASSDPQGSADIASRVVTLQTTSGAIVATVTTDAAGLGAVDGNVTRMLGPHSYRAVVELTDRTNRSAKASADIEVTNEAPVAFAPGVVRVPRRGAYWTSAPFVVRVAANGTSDAEGDTLTHSWTLERSTIPGIGPANATGGTLDVSIPPAALGTSAATGFAVWKYDAKDDYATSASTEVEVELDDPMRWIVAKSGAQAFVTEHFRETLDTSDRLIGQPALTFNPGGLPPTVSALCKCNPGACEILHRGPAALSLGCPSFDYNNGDVTFTADTRPLALVDDAARQRLWAVVRNFDPMGDSGVIVLDESGGPQSNTTPATVDISAFADDGNAFGVLDDASGDLWFGHDGADRILRLHSQLTAVLSTPYVAPAGQVVSSVALRPAQSGMDAWIAFRKDEFSSASPGIGLLVVSSDGTETAGTWDLPSELAAAQYVSGLRFLSADVAFAHLVGEGFAFFDVDEAAHALRFSRLIASTEGPGADYFADPQTFSIRMIEGGRQAIVHIPFAGTPTRAPSGSSIDYLSPPDPDGSTWMLLRQVIDSGIRALVVRGRGVGGEGAAISVVFPRGTAKPVQDYASGDLWVSSDFPAGAARFSQDGVVNDVFTSLDTGSAKVAPRVAAALSVDEQDGLLWYVEGNSSDTPAKAWLLDPFASRSQADAIRVAPGPWPVVLQSAGELAEAHAIAGGALVVTNTTVDPADATMLIRSMRTLGRDGALTSWQAVSNCSASSFLGCNNAVIDIEPTGGVCVASERNGTVTISRHDPSLALVWSQSGNFQNYPDGIDLLDIAAGPQECWVALRQSTFNGNVPNVVVRADIIGVAQTSVPNSTYVNVPALQALDLVEDRTSPSGPAASAWAGGGDGRFASVVYDGSPLLRVDTSSRLAVGTSSFFARH